jgi:hypothetical protein
MVKISSVPFGLAGVAFTHPGPNNKPVKEVYNGENSRGPF